MDGQVIRCVACGQANRVSPVGTLLIFFRNGVEAGRVVGAVPRAQIEAAIQRYLG